MDSSFQFTLTNYDIIKIIGTGAFGKVYFIINKKTKQPYALKAQKKNQIIKANQTEHVYSEYNVLKEINNTFLIKLHEFIQDNKYIYFVIDYIPGVELFTLMRTEINFTEKNTQFYVAQLIEALNYLHIKKIIYRDIKPENILLDSNGYIKLTDFGVSKKLLNNITNTLCGTPTYTAPEIILKKNYTFSSDWWSLGILTYEMIVGIDPWDENDPFQIYEKIKIGKIFFPKNMDKKVKSFIQHLLIGNPEKRMGSNFINGKNDIYYHKWFKDFNWESLLNKSMIAWHIPKVKKNNDTSNYKEYSDSESDVEEIENDNDPFLNW
jgi:serine/threonine protein kinase